MHRGFKFLTSTQVAKKLGISRPTAWRLIKTRAIARYRLLGRWLVHEDDLAQYMAKQRQPAKEEAAIT
jgi:excisionase family DNA binding protein